MWYNGLVILNIHLILYHHINYVYSGYIGPSNQKNNLRNNAYHRGYTQSGSKLEPPSRPSFNWDNDQYKPYFDDVHPLNITSQLGKTAYLHCAIRQLGDRVVSWVRQRDLHILTVGSYTYTSDTRFSCLHRDETYTLEIKHVVKEDQGVYVCQVSTEPKLSLEIRLIVQATKAIIPEGPFIQLAPKSFLKLTCLLEEANYQTRKNPSFVFWYKDGEVINYLSGRSELRVISNFIDGHHFYNRSSSNHQLNLQTNSFTHSMHHQSSPYFTNNQNNNDKYSQSSTYDHRLELQKSSSNFPLSYVGQLNEDENQLDDELFERDDQIKSKEIIVSVLTIDGVKPSDSGVYSCKPSYAEFANCTIQVLKDETIHGQISTHQQANTIYSNGNYEEEPKSIEFFDDEESFYIRTPSKILPSNNANSFFSYLIWISLFIGQLLILKCIKIV